MNAKRTCGECKRYPGHLALDNCMVPLPMWLDKKLYSFVRRDADATHCETFIPKQPRKDDAKDC